MQDDKGNDLLRMIVGKEVAGLACQRFVREAEPGPGLYHNDRHVEVADRF